MPLSAPTDAPTRSCSWGPVHSVDENHITNPTIWRRVTHRHLLPPPLCVHTWHTFTCRMIRPLITIGPIFSTPLETAEEGQKVHYFVSSLSHLSALSSPARRDQVVPASSSGPPLLSPSHLACYISACIRNIRPSYAPIEPSFRVKSRGGLRSVYLLACRLLSPRNWVPCGMEEARFVDIEESCPPSLSPRAAPA